MKIIFTSPNLIEVTQLKDLLERAGIATVIGNENSGYLSVIPGTEPELWIQDDDDLGEAMEIKADWLVSRSDVKSD